MFTTQAFAYCLAILLYWHLLAVDLGNVSQTPFLHSKKKRGRAFQTMFHDISILLNCSTVQCLLQKANASPK